LPVSLDWMLPIITYPEPAVQAGLRSAVEFIARVASRLSVVVQVIDIPPFHNVIAETLIDVSAMARNAERQSRAHGTAIAADIEKAAQELSLPSGCELLVTGPATYADALAALSRVHDAAVIVLDSELPTHVELAEAVLFGSGGPLLLCPPRDHQARLDSAMVAWDGSRAAARAIRDATPILKAAQMVTVVTAGEDKPIDSGSVDGVRVYLERHGIESSYREIRLNGDAVAQHLQEEAICSGSGLLVMGGYGHSRLREFVLGGVTAGVLRQGPLLPVFMSH
jgi:nucleotide-binding universal stress UspA family protein